MIPLITLVLMYTSYIAVGWTVYGLIGIERNIMVDQIIVQEGLGMGIMAVMITVLFVFGFLNRLGKQRTQAKEIEIKMTHGYEPTIEELLDMEKVKTVNKIYKIALGLGIVVSSIIGCLAIHFVLMEKIQSEEVFYFATLVLAFLDYLMVDYAVKSVANGEFEKVKQEMLEQFRKIEESDEVPVNAEEIAKSVSNAVADAVAKALSGIGKN